MGLNKLLADVSALINTFNAKKSDIEAAVAAAQTAVLANNKAYWVDPVAGLDSGAGTQAAPFRTIKKACDAVPVGGYGDITIIGDASVVAEITEDIFVRNKVLIIRSSITWTSPPELMPRMRNVQYVSTDGKRSTRGFLMAESAITFIGVHIETASWPDSSLGTINEGFIRRMDTSSAKVFVMGGKITLHDTPFVRRATGPSTLEVGTYAMELATSGVERQAPFAILDGMPAILGMYQSIIPAGTTWNDHITGISHHPATGMPLNVISNIDLSIPST